MRPTLESRTRHLIREAAAREEMLDDAQFVELTVRFLVWSGLARDVATARVEATRLSDDAVRLTGAWLRRNLGSADAVHHCELEHLMVTTEWDEEITASVALVTHFLERCDTSLELRAHELSKQASDDALRVLVGSARYDEVRAEYLRRGGTKPLISLYSKREWHFEVSSFFHPAGRDRESLARSLSKLIGRAPSRIYRRGSGRQSARWTEI